MTSSGIRYSNIEPLQESSAGAPAGSWSAGGRGEPVFLRQFSLRDGDEAGEPRFGGQQIVEAGIEAVLGDVDSRWPADGATCRKGIRSRCRPVRGSGWPVVRSSSMRGWPCSRERQSRGAKLVEPIAAPAHVRRFRLRASIAGSSRISSQRLRPTSATSSRRGSSCRSSPMHDRSPSLSCQIDSGGSGRSTQGAR